MIHGYCFSKPATAVAKPCFSDFTVQACQTVTVTGSWLPPLATGVGELLEPPPPHPAASTQGDVVAATIAR